MARRYSSLAAWMRATHTTCAKLAKELQADGFRATPAYVSMLKRKERQPVLKMALWIHDRSGGTVPLEALLMERPEVTA